MSTVKERWKEPRDARIPVWALPRSLAATCGIDVSFSSSGYLDVSVHRVPFLNLWIGLRILEVCSSGFPHSEISGSKDICSSPKLFAAYHVFHRLLVPRHPPYALISITNLLPPWDGIPLHTSSVMCVGNRFILFQSVLFRLDLMLLNITSDVLIKDIILNHVILSLISNNITSLCMQFSRYILTVLSVIRNQNNF